MTLHIQCDCCKRNSNTAKTSRDWRLGIHEEKTWAEVVSIHKLTGFKDLCTKCWNRLYDAADIPWKEQRPEKDRLHQIALDALADWCLETTRPRILKVVEEIGK